MSYLAVVINGLLICVTGDFLPKRNSSTRNAREAVGVFVGYTHLLFVLKVFIALLCDDVPADVRVQIARQKFVRDKLVARLPDPTPHVKLRDVKETPVDLTVADADWDEVYLDVPGYEGYGGER
mmetsp:Transcript_12830/g.38201  ORF Transcript_12830/g.38201 Transcript_12830/m.38201 type:complete len:124 (+) Transcript_12830:450-821(+)